KAQRARRAVAVAAVMAVASTTAARALDAGSLLAPVLGPLSGAPGPAGAVAPFSAPGGGYAAFATGTVLHAGLAGAVAGLDFVSGSSEAADLTIAGQGGIHGLWIGTGPGAAGTGAGALSRSESRTAVVPGSVSGRLGLMAETSEALGPLTLLAGTAGPTTVE